MPTGNSTLTNDQLGRLAVNLLHKAFIEATRTVSKRLFRQLETGDEVAVTQLELDDKQTVQLLMKLDASEYRGDLNFSAFRDSVAALLTELVTTLQEEGALRTLQATEADAPVGETHLLAAMGPTQHGADINVLMVSLSPSQVQPAITVSLLYMNPDQFRSSETLGES